MSLDALISPDKQAVKGSTFTLAGRSYQYESMCFYKVAQIMSLLTEATQKADLAGTLSTLSQDSVVVAALRLLPVLMKETPDVLIRCIALALVPNAELETLFQGTPGAIEARVASEASFLRFNASPFQVVELANSYIDLMGLDELKNALTLLVKRASAVLGSGSTN